MYSNRIDKGILIIKTMEINICKFSSEFQIKNFNSPRCLKNIKNNKYIFFMYIYIAGDVVKLIPLHIFSIR